MLRRVVRPRVVMYTAVLVALSAAMIVSLAARTPLKVNVVRDQTPPCRIIARGKLEAMYRLRVMNATEAPRSVTASARAASTALSCIEPELRLAPLDRSG